MQATSVNYKGEVWAPLLNENGTSTNQTGRKIYVRDKQQRAFMDIAKAAQRNFNQLYLQRQIVGLKGVGYFNSYLSRFTALDRMLPLEGGKLIYEVRGGDVYLKDILFDPQHRANVAGAITAAGVYKAKEKAGRWNIEKSEEVGYIDTKHAAINGAADGIIEAAKIMPAFIKRGYGETSLNNTYCLFYNPVNNVGGNWRSIRDSAGLGGGTQAARKLADVIEQTAARNKAVNWTVHEQGHAVFKQALRLLDTRGIRNLNTQTVFYANPTLNLELVDKYRKKVGMALAENTILINDFSLGQTWLSGNFVSERMVSWHQLSVQGENASKGKTKDAFIMSTAGRAMLVGGLLGAPSLASAAGAASAAGWAVSLLGIAGSNLRGKANQKIIETPAQALRHLRGAK